VYITLQITIQSCAMYAHAAEKYSCAELRDSMLSFMVAHFERVSHTDGFLELPAAFLLDVLQSNAIVVDKEENTFRSLMRWLEHDPSARASSLPLLLVCALLNCRKANANS
jgi:hypothetical protein